MKYSKLQQIKKETERMLKKLEAAIDRAKENNLGYSFAERQYKELPLEERECNNTKEAGSFKRAALDLKRELSNL